MPKKRSKFKTFIIVYVFIAVIAVIVTYNYDNIRFLNRSLEHSLESSDGLSDAVTEIFKMKLENLHIFTETQVKYIYDDKEQLARALEYFERTCGMRVFVAEENKGCFGSDGTYMSGGTDRLDKLFDEENGFADVDFDGNGVMEYAVYCAEELSDKRHIMTIGICSGESIGKDVNRISDISDSVYFVSEDGNYSVRLDAGLSGEVFENMDELKDCRTINAGGQTRTKERGSAMIKKDRDRYAVAYSEVGLDWMNDSYYIMVIDKVGTMLNESNMQIYKIVTELVFFLILGIPFFVMYYKYIKADMELADSISANEAKTRFLSKFSHDFRTPMNALIGMTEIAGMNVDDPKEVSYCLSKISTSADYMLEMLSDILDISKIESDKLELVEEPFSLMEIIKSINSLMYVQAANKKIAFTIKKKVSPDIFLIGDSVRLKQVLVNLISNAIKYTGEGGKVQFHADETMRDDQKVHICFRVMDDGIGMSQEFMERMYEPFECERKSGVNKSGDSIGLGLSICSSLVKLMGGSIQARSRVGEGTEFAVEIDFAYKIKERNYHANTANISAKYDFGGRRILLADDNLTNLDIAARQLKWVNAEVDMATDGQKAVNRYLENPVGYYDAILMDIQMPYKSGLEAARDIRQSGRADSLSIPIAAMTANAFGDDREAAVRYGMDVYLTKPIKMQILYASLDKIFSESDYAAGRGGFLQADFAATDER